MLHPILPDQAIIKDATVEQVPGGAFESEDLPDPPGLGFIRPGNQRHPARDGDLDLAALSEREKTALGFRRNRMEILLSSTGGTEAVVRVTVRRGVPVTVR